MTAQRDQSDTIVHPLKDAELTHALVTEAQRDWVADRLEEHRDDVAQLLRNIEDDDYFAEQLVGGERASLESVLDAFRTSIARFRP